MDFNSKSFVMLSHNIKNIKTNELEGNWYCSHKHDGVRAIWNGSKLLTRSKREFNYVPEWFKRLLPKDKPLEGELLVPSKPFNYFSGITVNKKDDDRWNEIVFLIFDIPLGGIIFNDRIKLIEQCVNNIKSVHIRMVNFELIKDITNNMNIIHDKFNKIVSKGGEGIMLIKDDNLYQAKRVKTILKYKKEIEDEAVVIGYLEGTGKYKGFLGKLKCKFLDSDKTFNVGGGFLDIQRNSYIFIDNKVIKIISNNEIDIPIIGDIITYKCMELTCTGLPRMPIFRCIRRDINIH